MRKSAGKKIVSIVLIPLLLAVFIGGIQMATASLGESGLGESGSIALFADSSAITFKIPMPSGFSDPTPVLVITSPFAGTVSYAGGIDSSFGYAEKGDVMIYNNELMRAALAVVQGNLTESHQLGYGPEWKVEFHKP